MRMAARIDGNQPEIVEALRKVGATVYIIKWPVDLMVGYRKRTIAMEVKDPKKDWRLTEDQQKFFRDFQGEAYIVEDIEQAIKALNMRAA